MDLEDFREHCLNKPHVTESTPFGEDVLVFKVAGKMFALAALDEIPVTVNLKCDPDLALELRDRYEQVRPGYHMNKKHWNTVELGGEIPHSDLRKMVDHSYELVVKSLPKSHALKISAAMDGELHAAELGQSQASRPRARHARNCRARR
jgi:predicted DNA-binding protein (MmcQ/YjbR family)